MSKRIAIVQSNYIPWKGYFDLIRQVDEFVLYDDVQYTRRDWRNRNRIKTADGVQWLTIPVQVKGNYFQTIRATRIDGTAWQENHWTRLRHAYKRTLHFKHFAAELESFYTGPLPDLLSEVNERLIRMICAWMGIDAKITQSSSYDLSAADPTERLLAICLQAGATEYLSGPAARTYMREELFAEAGIRLSYMDYSGYPEYPQIHPPFEHSVTALDLLFHAGPEATLHLERLRKAA